jgi:hypothetical protein
MSARPEYGRPYGLHAAGAGYLRASTADREHAIDVLKTGFAEGRLTKEEYDARAGQAFAARTVGDLAVITADLPDGLPSTPPWPASARTNGLAMAALVCALGQPFTAFLSTVPAIVFGHLARREIRRTGERGMGMATFGLALGWIGGALLLLMVLLMAGTVALSHPGGLPGQRRLSGAPCSVDSAATKASWGTSTRPMTFMRRLPSFCRSSSLRLRVMSPP